MDRSNANQLFLQLLATNTPRFEEEAAFQALFLREQEGKTEVLIACKAADSLRRLIESKTDQPVVFISLERKQFERYVMFWKSRHMPNSDHAVKVDVNCPPAFKSQCTQDWFAMQPTQHEWVRHCASCEKMIVFCQYEEEVEAARQVGACAAVYAPQNPIEFDSTDDLLIGDLI